MSNSGKCKELHIVFNSLKRLSFPIDKKYIPSNGIYVLFEKGETGHGCDRIVRVGTHTGEGQLYSRLRQHFDIMNKDRSIFRKNIGRALLNEKDDPYLEKWEWDLTTKEKREKYTPLIDEAYQSSIEETVSEIIQTNFSFVVFEVNSKAERLLIESRIISEVSNCSECIASEKWLGNFSPKEKICKSGLWLVNELYKNGFSSEEYNLFLQCIESQQEKSI